MPDIKGQLIKNSYNYVLQSDLITGIVYRIGGDVPTNPKFISGLTVNANFTYSNGTEFPGYVLTCDAAGNAVWSPVSGSTSSVVVTGFTYDDSNNLTIKQNEGQSDLTVNVSIVTGLTSTGDINISGNTNVNGYVQFDDNSSETSATARLTWNDTDGTLDLGLKGGNVVLQIGQEQLVRVVNKTGANLLESNYQAVRIDGAQGNRVKITLAQANNDANSIDTIGLVTEDINNNQEGFVTTMGLVRNINTTGSLQGESWTDGDILYLSPTVAGRITNIKPISPQHTIIIGYVVQSNPSNGSIFVKVDNGYELGELHNVLVTDATDGQVLTYSASTALWVPTTISGGTDVYVTGGTFNGSQIEFTNTTGGTFDVTGFTNTTGGIATWSQGVNGSVVSGTTTNSVTYSQLISGGTMGNGNLIRTNWRCRWQISSQVAMRIYINTTPDLTGTPILAGTYNNGGAISFRVNSMLRTLIVKDASSSTEAYLAAGITPTDLSLYNNISNLNVDWTVDQYFIFALQHTSTSQVSYGSFYLIEKI